MEHISTEISENTALWANCFFPVNRIDKITLMVGAHVHLCSLSCWSLSNAQLKFKWNIFVLSESL